jgi:hypothetical protein
MIYIGRQPAAAPITSADIANDTIVNDDIAANAAIAQSKLNLSLSTSDISGDAAALGSGASADGYVLTSDGAGGAAWEEVSGGGVESFVATGSISSGDIVGLRSDGTVEVIADGTETLTNSAGTPVVFENGVTSYISATFDSNSNKVVIAYRDQSANGRGTAAVGTVSGTTITFGTPVVFEDGGIDNTSATFDSNSNKVVIAYRDAGNSDYGTAVVGTVSGTSISFGIPVVFESANISYTSAIFDPNANKVVIPYMDALNGNQGTVVVGTVSGTSITFGTPVVFYSSTTTYISATFDSNANKVVIAYYSSNYGIAVVCTISGTSISFGSLGVFKSNANISYISATFDSNSNKVVIVYNDGGNSSYGTAVVGTVSGTSISFGTPVVFESAATYWQSATFDSNTNKVVIAYRDGGNSEYGTAVVGTISGTSISFGTPVVFNSGLSNYNSATFDSSTNKVVIAYVDGGNSSYGTASVFQAEGTGTTTNADSWIGIADGTSGTVKIIGGVAGGLTGLTTGATYYVSYDGTLTTTENAGPLAGTYGKIGRALSSTKLLITEGNA